MTFDVFQKNRSTVSGAHAQMHEQARHRLLMVVMVLAMGYLAIAARLVDLAMMRKAEVSQVVRQDNVKPLQKPLRGTIYDRNGVLMATSLKMASLYTNPTMIENPEELAKQLVKILPELNAKDLVQKFKSGKQFVWIQRDITPKQEYAINALGNPALGFQEEDRRIYPNGNLTAHITGYTDVDGKGMAGIERFFEGQLSAAEKPVSLSVDLRVQHMMHRELSKAMDKFRAKAAIGMVMDVNTGEIVSMVSLPDFDPNHVGDAKDNARFNRTTLGVFEMGSTFKLFSTAAALDSGQVHFSSIFDASTPIKMGRFKISDFHAKNRTLTVPEIFIYSSNIGTAKMAEKLGNEKMQQFYRSLGFMDQTQVEVSERGSPIYPKPWRDISTLTTSFGHGIAITPVQLVRAASALVNGGKLYPATLLKVEQGQVLEGKRVVSSKTSHQLQQLLEMVVVNGTGLNAYVEGYNVGGKTGTAEKNINGKYEHDLLLSSFLGFFPIQEPRFAVLVMLDEPRGTEDTKGYATGGWTAAPVVARVVEEMGPLYHIEPNMQRTASDIDREMGVYLKEYKGGKSLASLGADH